MKPDLEGTQSSLNEIDARAIDVNERAHRCCAFAGKFIGAGDYESARVALSSYWTRIGEPPRLDDLNEAAAAEMSLTVGVLAGWIGAVKQVEGAQSFAKDLISKSLTLFENLGNATKAIEAQVELAFCYWREGAGEEARILFQEAINKLRDDEHDLKALALVRLAAAERTSMRTTESMRSLNEAKPLIEISEDHGLKGRFHIEFANLLQSLGAAEHHSDYMDRALIEYTAASYHFEEAGHVRYCAYVENNLGYLFQKLGKFNDAHTHLDRALLLFSKLNDAVSAAQVRETRARTYLAQGRLVDAEVAARTAIQALEKSGEQALLAEALITRATSLARINKHSQAQTTFERAITTALEGGSTELAGLATLEMIEEQSAVLPLEHLRSSYAQADEWLKHSQDPTTLDRLRQAARKVFAQHQSSNQQPGTSGRVAPDSSESPLAKTEVKRSPLTELIEEISQQQSKQIHFTPQAIEAIEKFFYNDKFQELRAILERTILQAEQGMTITEDAVETTVLRHSPDATFANPWAGFSLRQETREVEARFIMLALKEAAGKISIAAKLLGFPHNELLTSIIKSRHPELLSARTPVIPRKRSIISKKQKK